MTRHGSHTESRMRENCTYGSMRGRAFPPGRPALLYTLLVLVTSAETAPPLARPLATVGDCAYEDRRPCMRKMEEWKGTRVGRWWRRRLMGMRKKSDGHQNEF